MISFYRTSDPYGFFSNFSRHAIDLDGRRWPTTEHYFQAMKFWPHAPKMIDEVAQAETPKQAARLGRSLSPIRSDWDAYPPIEVWSRIPFDEPIDARHSSEPLFARTKDVFMYLAVQAKFTQHDDLRKALIETRDQSLVEDTANDAYWGNGNDNKGHNKLGRLLILVRDFVTSQD